MTRRDLWRDATDLEVVETHISRVFLGEERVWKIKKPVDLGFLDFTTAEKRRAACRAEVELNRRLAPDVYSGVVPVLRRADGRLLVATDIAATDELEGRILGDGESVDWAVLMRRLAEECRADRLLAAGRLGVPELERVASRLARFHADARCDGHTARFGTVEAVRRNVEENFRQTRGVLEEHLGAERAGELRRWQEAFLARNAERFEARIDAGRVRDGHGDLRLEHVYLDADDVVIVDCIEFSDRFRFADVCADVAFLAMDLGVAGRPDLAERFLAAYAAAAQDYDLYPLVDFYESYRAFVRGKVATLVAASDDASAADRRRAEAEARRHFLLALSSERRPLLPPRLVAVGGWIAAGKSTTARRVAERLDAPVLEADRTRKHLVGVASDTRLWVEPFTGPYDEETTDEVYAELLRRAEVVLRSRRSVVIDASFRRRDHRRAVRELARELEVPCLFVECLAAEDVCRRRLRRRHRDDAGATDGRLAIFDDFVASYEEIRRDEFTTDELLHLDTGTLGDDECEERLARVLPAVPASAA